MTRIVDLRDSSILIAGASGGIGSAIARRLAAEGVNLTLVARRADGLDGLDVAGQKLTSDLRAPGEADRVVSLAIAENGSLDAVINCVGVVAFGDVSTLGDDVLEELFLTNVFVNTFLARAAIAHLGSGGVFMSVSGVISEKNLPGMAAYGASKAAVRSFGSGLAREARRGGVRVIDARPPHTETGLATRAIAGEAPKFPRGLSPESVADVIAEALADDQVNDLPSSAFSA